MKNLTENMIKYENGDMEAGEVMQFFQELIDSGLAWKLQGHYGRTANALIEEGLCRVKAITIDS
tara:strand:- start:3351 stop:3542 length:192 start_codon:yes stop_codon:yes gene_type:complete